MWLCLWQIYGSSQLHGAAGKKWIVGPGQGDGCFEFWTPGWWDPEGSRLKSPVLVLTTGRRGTQNSGLHSVWRNIQPGEDRPSANPVFQCFSTPGQEVSESDRRKCGWGTGSEADEISSRKEGEKARGTWLREGWSPAFYTLKRWGWVLQEQGRSQGVIRCSEAALVWRGTYRGSLGLGAQALCRSDNAVFLSISSTHFSQ